ncbi:asnC family protein, partial [Vibrio parahaemolyticus V-223/04]
KSVIRSLVTSTP